MGFGKVFTSIGGFVISGSNNVFINGRQIIGGGGGIEGSGIARTDVRQVPEFGTVKSLVPGDVTIRKGDSASVTVEADDNIVPIIMTEVSGGALVIAAEGSFSTRKPIRVSVTVPGRMPDLDLIGSGDIDMSGIAQERLSVNLQGSGDITLDGEVRQLELRVMGSGDVDAKRLVSENASINLMGSGDIDAHATESVSVTLMGSGDVTVSGSPKQKSSTKMGSGDVTIR
jgi:hypothetical protein